MHKSLLLISMLAVIHLASSSATMQQRILCSEKLNEMMGMVCEEFNTITENKRSMRGDDSIALSPLEFIQEFEEEVEDNSISEPLQNRIFRGNSLGSVLNSLTETQRRTRQRMGIVDRCCRNKCHISVLLEYCAVPRN
ncbi:probable insulin-like peptide 2 [Drosophila eugracilis]|uniref:probable insulin-like peptide 2 n=1 Tax=Drosophila eugracilis TaxID=29029 RepID=UPI0007E63282|nr:probable insulin-like peptide 2 [Drosophila eugracilis]